MKPITRLSCVYLQTPDLDSSIDFYTRCFGLALIERTDTSAALHGTQGTARQLVLQAGARAALTGLEYLVESHAALQALTQALEADAIALAKDTLPFPVGDALALHDPDGTLLRIGTTQQIDAGRADAGGDRPGFLSHVVINSPSPQRLIDFYVNQLGFRIADAYEKNLLTFLRCRQPQHHCVGISPAAAAGLNHFAMDCGSIDGVMKGVGRMRKAGHEPVWGPGRHGPGGNVFCYYADPVNLVAEFTSNLGQIEDDAAWQPQIWPRTPENGNVWGTSAPSPRAIDLMSGVIASAAPSAGR